MGCGYSKVLDIHEDQVATSGSDEGREWKVFDTDTDLMIKYITDGTMLPKSSKEHLELRTLLDESSAAECILRYAESLNCGACLRLWLAIQDVKRDDSDHDTVRQHVQRVFETYLEDPVTAKVEFLDVDWINDVRDAIATVSVTNKSANDEEESGGCRSRSKSFSVSKGTNRYIDKFCLNRIQRECFLMLFVEVFVGFKACKEYRELLRSLKKKYNFCQPDDFQFYNKLGEGSFGVVVHVRKKSTRTHYAMKIQTKIALLNKCLEDPGRVDFEKQAMMACMHPFIARIDYAFETSSLAIIVMEYCNGVDLAKILKQVPDGRLPENTVCFIAAEIVCALTYMHSRGLLYRDLKPGNVLLNKDGHVQLIDLGTVGDLEGECLQAVDPMASGLIARVGSSAKGAKSSPSQVAGSFDQFDEMFTMSVPKRAMSVVGTMAFMAPEVTVMLQQQDFERQGYSSAVDYWSLGATMYNMVVGEQPFAGSKQTNRTLKGGCAAISPAATLNGDVCSPSKKPTRYELNYPKFLSPDTIDVITRFLDVNPATRLVNIDEIRAHPFFHRIDWERLEKKKVLPPYVPKQEESVRIPEYENFAMAMSALGIENWLDCAPPPALDKYFNEWNYVSDHVVPLEKELQETARRLRVKRKDALGTCGSKSGSKSAFTSSNSGLSSNSPSNSVYSSVRDGHSGNSGVSVSDQLSNSHFSAFSQPAPDISNLRRLNSSDDAASQIQQE